MAIIKALRGKEPQIAERVFLAENAAIIGDVSIGKDSSIWYGAVLRGDVNGIVLGERVNIQDGAVLHALYEKSSVIIGNDVSVGHNAIVHGAIIGNSCLIGMGAIIMDNAQISDNTIIGAGALVPANAVLEAGVYAGVPAKKIKDASPAVSKAAFDNAQGYLMYKDWYQ